MIKKYGTLLLIGVLLAAAVCVKVFGERGPADDLAAAAAPVTTPAPAVAQNYFAAFRSEREAVREKEMQYLDEVIATSAVDDETLAQAVEQKLALVENMEAEFTMESQIDAKGFTDAAVTFHNGTVTVVVEAENLNAEEVAQILDIVQRETGASASNVKITTNLQ